MAAKESWFCTECGEMFGKWQGQCANCQTWNTIKEFREPGGTGKTTKIRGKNITKEALNSDSPPVRTGRMPVGMHEVDRVLGGGFFPGSLILFGGAPGVGKSTLALQVFDQIDSAIYFSGEESAQQVQHRLERLTEKKSTPEAGKPRIFSTHSLEDILTTIEQERPPLVIVDSIQMVGTSEASFGTMSHIRENAELLLKTCKATHTTILIIGHVTKNDELAGPKVLEHMVDTVLRLEGDRDTEVRILRAPKNRFGSTLEIGVFEMRTSGLLELKNPAEFFLRERAENAFGSIVTVMREGIRNFLLEVQVLTIKTNFGQPRRTSHGVDLSKFHLLLAVVSKYTPFRCGEYDAYLNVIGGLKIKDPGADLAIAAAILSSRMETEVPADTIILGEVGLSGEVRSVPQIEARLQEVMKLGFKTAVIPKFRGKNRPEIPKELRLVEVKSVGELVKWLGEKK